MRKRSVPKTRPTTQTRKEREPEEHPDHWKGWEVTQNTLLMRCLLAGLPLTGPNGLTQITGRTWKGVDRQGYKICQHYTDYGRRSEGLVAVKLGTCRAGLPWVLEDYWVFGTACNERGRAHGADNPTHIARCTGRTVTEVRTEWKRIIKTRPGFGLFSESQTIAHNLHDKVVAVNKKFREILRKAENHEHSSEHQPRRIPPLSGGRGAGSVPQGHRRTK